MGSPSKSRSRPTLTRIVLAGLALLTAAWGLSVAATGGVAWNLGPLRVSSRTALRPLLLSGALAAWYLYRYGSAAARSDLATLWRGLTRPRILAAIAAGAAAFVGVASGAHAVGGSDSYGYLSQAELWLRGGLQVEQAFVGEYPWPNAALTMTPLGHRPTGDAGNYVPVYPPGFPLALALFMAVGGEAMAYLVVPLLGAAAVWWTYCLGSAVWDESAGLMAAVLLLASPAFLFMLVAGPMSDIPATAWWLLAAVAIVGRADGSRWPLVASGLAVTMAVLTRPNLAPLAALYPLLIASGSPTWSAAARRVGVWIGPALAGPVLLAFLNTSLYGSPLQSGYDDATTMFAWRHAWPNVQRYSGWLLETQTPFIFGGLVTPVLAWRLGAGRRSVVLALWSLAFAGVVAAAYLWYTVFGAWWFLRFLLPAYPMLLVAAAAGAAMLAGRHGRLGVTALVLLVALVGGRGLSFAQRELVFSLGDGEYRYKEVGLLVRSLPANSVVISFQHSGSLRHYGRVLTLRYDVMPPEWLDRAVEHLAAAGHPVYAVLDGWEIDEVRKRFSARSRLGWLERPPIEITPGRVAVYDVTAASR